MKCENCDHEIGDGDLIFLVHRIHNGYSVSAGFNRPGMMDPYIKSAAAVAGSLGCAKRSAEVLAIAREQLLERHAMN